MERLGQTRSARRSHLAVGNEARRRRCLSEAAVLLFEVLEEVGCTEVVGDRLIQTSDDLIDGFLPRRLGVFACLDGFEELAHGLRHDINKGRRNLEMKMK